MVTINYAFREISCKIVYYGPGLSGKTTNLQYVHDRVPSKSRGDLISLATETDRTLYFDFLPIHVGDIAGFATKFQLYTVPGQVFYNATRKLVLRGVDGIVFVADSQNVKMDENVESLSNMYENLRENGIEATDIPIVFQYNKRDLPDIAPMAELEKTLNPNGWPCVEAAAVNGTGVFDTLKRITKMVLEQTKKRTAASPPPGLAATVAAASEPVQAAAGQSPAATVAVGEETPKQADSAWSADDRSPVAVAGPEPPARPRSSLPATPGTAVRSPRSPQVTPMAGAVLAPQRSLRVRTRRSSRLSRLLGWLFSR